MVGVEMSPALGNQGGPNRVAEALAKEMAQVLSQDVPWETYSTAKLISGADLARIQVPQPEKTLETSGVLLDAAPASRLVGVTTYRVVSCAV